MDLKAAYNEYLIMCLISGDIWWEYYTPYSFEEWIENSQPDNPGKNNEFCKKYNKTKND